MCHYWILVTMFKYFMWWSPLWGLLSQNPICILTSIVFQVQITKHLIDPVSLRLRLLLKDKVWIHKHSYLHLLNRDGGSTLKLPVSMATCSIGVPLMSLTCSGWITRISWSAAENSELRAEPRVQLWTRSRLPVQHRYWTTTGQNAAMSRVRCNKSTWYIHCFLLYNPAICFDALPH